MKLATIVLSGTLVVLGGALIVRTVSSGVGGGFGLLLGGLFVAAGAARLYLSFRT